MRRIPLLLVPLFAISLQAEAQVLITEVQPNPTGAGTDSAEWVELHNTGMASVDISGYTISDYGATTPRQFAFPAGTSIAAGQVMILARQATPWIAIAITEGYAVMTPDFEFDTATSDDPNVPNMPIVVMGSGNWGLSNSGSDGVLFRDALNAYVDGVEYGTLDRAEIPGVPQSIVPADGQTLRRIAAFGSSIIDFDVGTQTAGTGYVAPPNTTPVVTNTFGAPRHLFAGTPLVVTANAADSDPITVSLYTAIATSSAGPASAMYTSTTMTATTAPGYIGTYNPIVVVPATFHDTYIRFYVHASDATGSNTEPNNATPDATNTAYFARNLMPLSPSSITEVREQDANETPLYRYHSATIEGVALTRGIAFVANTTNFFIRSTASGDAIRVFSRAVVPENIVEGDLVRVTGMIDIFNGLRQIGEPDIDVTILGPGLPALPAPAQTIGAVIANGEALEGQLVQVANVTLVGMPATWPTNGNVNLTDGIDTIVVRISTPLTDLSGQPAPQGVFNLQGILGQFSATGIGGYQLLPRGANDVFMAMPPVDAGIDDSGVDPDAGPPLPDTGIADDSGTMDDSGMVDDSGMRQDTGVVPPDSGMVTDTGVVPPDGGMNTQDGAVGDDAGPARVDAGGGGGGGGGANREEGCGCSTAQDPSDARASALALIALGLALILRRKTHN